MKALNCNLKLILAVLLLSGPGLFAQDAKKSMHEEFNTNSSTILSIDTKFSEVILNTWDKNTAEFDVTIEVKNTDKSKAEKLLKEINVNINKDGNTIYVETDLDDNFNKGVQKVAQQFSIIIKGNVPSNINLDLETKFGPATLGSFSGNADISVSFGRLEAEQLTGKEISISLNQGELSIGKINDAEIESNFSFCQIIEAGNIDLELNQGETKLGMVNNLSAEVNMGSLVVKMVEQSFESVDIEMNAGNVELGLSENAGFTIDAEVKMGTIDLPHRIGKVDNESHKMHSFINGKYGDGKSSIDIEGKLGHVELKLK